MTSAAFTYPNVELLIDGVWRQGVEGRTQPIVDPATDEEIGKLAHATRADLDAALSAAQKGFLVWRQTSAYNRSRVMRKAAEIFRSRADYVAWLITREQGKPLAADALEMAEAAEAAGAKTQVGFNYLCNPMLGLAREMIAAGELGEIRGYRGVHAEDYMADSAGPFTFRHDPAGGGALADIGSHALATAEFLMGAAAGPITSVMGECVTVIAERPDGKGGMRCVEVDDVGRAFLRFASGATGSIEGNWIATGRKMQHDFEVYGAKGALAFSQERFNELHFFSTEDKRGRQGFRRIEAGPDHAPYGLFCVAAGHQLGFNDLKAIEVAGYLDAVAGRRLEPFNFRAGLRIQTLVETIHASSRAGAWREVR